MRLRDKILGEFNEKATQFETPLYSIERGIENLRLMAELNQKLIRNGIPPVCYNTDFLEGAIILIYENLKEIKEKLDKK